MPGKGLENLFYVSQMPLYCTSYGCNPLYQKYHLCVPGVPLGILAFSVVGRSLVQMPIYGSCSWKRSLFNFFVAGEDVFSLCFKLLMFSVVGEETLVSEFHVSTVAGYCMFPVAEKASSLCSNYLVISCGWRLSLCFRYICGYRSVSVMFPVA